MNSKLIVYGFSSSVSAAFLGGQLAYLRQHGYEIAVVSSPGTESEKLAREEGARFFAIPIAREISPLRDLVSLIRIYRLLRKMRPVITNFGTPKAGLLGGLASFAARVPCRIYTLHGLRMETSKSLKRRVLWCTERLAVGSAHLTLCVSPSLRAKAIAMRLVRPDDAVVLANGSCNGVVASRYGDINGKSASQLRARLEIPAGAPVVGFVGRFVRDKGIPELVDAFLKLSSEHPALRLLLVGDFESGDPVGRRARMAIVRHPRIIVTGFVRDAAPYYQLMDVLALPTYREGMPVTSLEAQAAGVPVVTTSATGAVDSIVDGTTGVVVPVGDAGALVTAIADLLQNPEKRFRMGQAGKERIEKKFVPEHIWTAVLNLYRQLMQQRLGNVPEIGSSSTVANALADSKFYLAK
jgi:glycosyltransferase involved in cell wall biosynthesis